MILVLFFTCLAAAIFIAKVIIYLVQKKKVTKKAKVTETQLTSPRMGYDDSCYSLFYSETDSEVSFWGNDDVQTALTFFFCIIAFVALLMGIIIGMLQYHFVLDYEQTLYVKQMLEKRVGDLSTYDNAAKELLYNEITSFNNTLRETKWLSSSPLVSWFNNWRIASIDYIII